MAKPESEFDVDVATNVMESGLLRVLTKESAAPPPAEDTVETALPPAPPEPAPPEPTRFVAALPPPAPRRRGSRVMRVALGVAVFVLATDVAMVAFHERHRLKLKLPPAPPLPTYMVLPPPAPTPPPPPAAAAPAAVEAAPVEAAPVVAADPPPQDASKHGRHHHHAKH